jgi:anti-sigma factor RsiW
VSSDQLRLMRYYDGELDADEAAELEAELERDAEARGVLAGLEQLSGFVRREAAERDVPDLTDAIMAEVAREPRQDRTAPAPAPAGWRVIVPAAAAVLALAASVALVNEFSAAPAEPVRVVQQPPLVVAPPEEPAAVPLVVAERDAVAIETVDFGAREGTIFVVQEGEGSTPVVWLMDEPAPAGGRMEPL